MSKISDKRPKVQWDKIEDTISDLRVRIQQRLIEKGDGAWLSSDEIRGLIQRELHELDEGIHQKDLANVHEELMDIAIGCIFGATCVYYGYVHW